jgi:hypothetical protein
MNNYNDLFVSAVALVGSVAAFAVGVGRWQQPYRLRTIAAVVDRYGTAAARLVWIALAIISFIAGVAIAGGVRPGYAKPKTDAVGAAR